MLISEEIVHKQSEIDFDIIKTRDHVLNSPLRTLESPERIAINLQYRLEHGMSASFSALERSIAGDDTLGSDFFERGLKSMRSVGRIRINLGGNGTVYGTGFLVAPNILMTNNHVIGERNIITRSEVDFGYEIDAYGREKTPFIFRLDPEIFLTSKKLDFTLVGVSSNTIRGDNLLKQFGFLPLNPQPAKVLLKQCMSIIQHPNGRRKRLAIRENRLIKIKDHHLWYYTDTERGSSGAPVFNDAWEVVGLHHSGVIREDQNGNYLKLDGTIWDGKTPIDDSLLDWMANEAVRTSTIYTSLQSEFKAFPGVADVLGAHQKPVTSNSWSEAKAKLNTSNIMDQPYHVNIPITIVVGNGSSANSPLPQLTFSSGSETLNAPSIGTSFTDTSNKDDFTSHKDVETSEETDILVESYRDGYNNLVAYDPKHLGPGKRVDLPKPTDQSLLREVLSYPDVENATKEWLDYIHFSIMMNKRWKFSMISAVNIDGSQEQSHIDRRKWFIDTRISEENQFNPKIKNYYGTKTMNRGHMVRREDPNWGERTLAVKANDFTFHLTNAVPQAASLNQKRWLMLEDYIKDQAWNEDQKVSVFTAPVLLESEENKERGWFGTYKDSPIPMAFWKVVAYLNESNELSCAAFIMNQVVDISRMEVDFSNPPQQEIKVSQITLNELSRISGIKFDQNLYQGDAYTKKFKDNANMEGSQETVIKRLNNITI